MYKQAIIIFGMAIPGGVLLLAFVIMWTSLNNFKAERDRREEAHKKAVQSQKQESLLETRLEPRRGQMEYWEALLRKDTVQSFNENFDLIMGRYDSNQLSPPTGRPMAGKGSLGTGVEANSTLFQLSFEGGFGPMQEALAELQIRMPQLVLNRMKLSPGKEGRGSLGRKLKFELSYQIWGMPPG